MSKPREPEPVKLVSSIFSQDKVLIEKVKDELINLFGPVDRISNEFMFDRTRYYEKEMGWPLYRRFVSFKKLILASKIVSSKLETNELEKKHVSGGNRKVNIDPGCLSHERLILLTGKNYIHRIYLSKGIYADLTLIYKRGGFRPLEWTYPDYRENDTIEFFNGVRELYTGQLKEMKRVD
jgi:hypothetical protein